MLNSEIRVVIYHNYVKLRNSSCYPLVMADVAIENSPVEIVDFPSYKMVIFQFAMLVYQRGYTTKNPHVYMI